MSELRNYILNKLEEKIDFSKKTIQGKAARKTAAGALLAVKQGFQRSGLAKKGGDAAKLAKEYSEYTYKHKPKQPKPENSSTDLRTQLAYVLADKLEEYRGKRFGYEPGEAPARGEGALKTAVGDALSKMRYGTTKPAEVEGGVIKDPGTRGGISTPVRTELGNLSKTDRWKKTEKKPGMPRLPSRKDKEPKPATPKVESTNLKDRMVDILFETYRSGYGSSRRRRETAKEREDRKNWDARDAYWSGKTDSHGDINPDKVAPGGSDEGHKDSPKGHR